MCASRSVSKDGSLSLIKSILTIVIACASSTSHNGPLSSLLVYFLRLVDPVLVMHRRAQEMARLLRLAKGEDAAAAQISMPKVSVCMVLRSVT